MKLCLFILIFLLGLMELKAQLWIQPRGIPIHKVVIGETYTKADLCKLYGEPVSFKQDKSEIGEEDPYDFKYYDYDSLCFCSSDDQLKCFCTTSRQMEVHVASWDRPVCIGDKLKSVKKMVKANGHYIVRIIDFFRIEIPDPLKPSESFVLQLYLGKKRRIINIEGTDPRAYDTRIQH